jgi:hypothetical protein
MAGFEPQMDTDAHGLGEHINRRWTRINADELACGWGLGMLNRGLGRNALKVGGGGPGVDLVDGAGGDLNHRWTLMHRDGCPEPDSYRDLQDGQDGAGRRSQNGRARRGKTVRSRFQVERYGELVRRFDI